MVDLNLPNDNDEKTQNFYTYSCRSWLVVVKIKIIYLTNIANKYWLPTPLALDTDQM